MCINSVNYVNYINEINIAKDLSCSVFYCVLIICNFSVRPMRISEALYYPRATFLSQIEISFCIVNGVQLL